MILNDQQLDPKLESVMKKLKYEDQVPRRVRALVKTLALHFGLKAKIRGVEVGVERGVTTEILLKCFPRLHLWAIDSWQEGLDKDARLTRSATTQIGHDDNLIETLQRIRPYRERCRVIWDLAEKANEQFVIGGVDFVFLDANHSYECVKADLADWWPIVKPGGLLCGDDYGERMEKHEFAGWGVKKAVDEFATVFETVGMKRIDKIVNTAPMNFFWIEKT